MHGCNAVPDLSMQGLIYQRLMLWTKDLAQQATLGPGPPLAKVEQRPLLLGRLACKHASWQSSLRSHQQA